jgi:hypothetical protein
MVFKLLCKDREFLDGWLEWLEEEESLRQINLNSYPHLS